MENQEQELPKKCFCARCFLPIDNDDKVDIEGQSFHRLCSTCCICRTIPTSLKMFYGHVFCNECFKTHVLSRFKGDSPRMHSNSWWMQWAPGKPQEEKNDKNENDKNENDKNENDKNENDKNENDKNENDKEEKDKNEESKGAQKEKSETPRKCICARCLQAVDESSRIDIGGQSFHTQCAKCYFCHSVPTSSLKIYYGQVFCEDCFNRYVLNRNKDNPSEFFKSCFEQWQNSAQFGENMRDFMAGNNVVPMVFMMPPGAGFARCGAGPQEWFQAEPKKSATQATVSIGEESVGTWDLSFENRTEVSDLPESLAAIDESATQENLVVAAAEKIEKLTKYLHERHVAKDKSTKKWKNFQCDKTLLDVGSDIESQEQPSFNAWVNLQDPKTLKSQSNCPKCLWQCGRIYVNSDYLNGVRGENYAFE